MSKPARKQRIAKKAAPRRRETGKVNVFISYSHDDFAIARTLWQQITTMDAAGFNVFLDAETIKLGSDWKDEIARKVKDADIFIAVYTGDQKHVFDYCGFEVGLCAGSKIAGVKKKMFCIYDTKDPPTILNGLQGVQISYDAGEKLLKTEGWQSDLFAPQMKSVFSLCYQLYAKRRRAHLPDQSEMKARELIRAFHENKGDKVVDEQPLHERLSITLPAVTDWDTMTSIPPTSNVMGAMSSFNLLGVPGGVPEIQKDQNVYAMDCKGLVDFLSKRAGNVVPWIKYVEASILAQLTAGASQPPPLSFMGNDNNSYRPIIGRFKVFRNGTRRYYVSLIPRMMFGELKVRLFPSLDGVVPKQQALAAHFA